MIAVYNVACAIVSREVGLFVRRVPCPLHSCTTINHLARGYSQYVRLGVCVVVLSLGNRQVTPVARFAPGHFWTGFSSNPPGDGCTPALASHYLRLPRACLCSGLGLPVCFTPPRRRAGHLTWLPTWVRSLTGRRVAPPIFICCLIGGMPACRSPALSVRACVRACFCIVVVCMYLPAPRVLRSAAGVLCVPRVPLYPVPRHDIGEPRGVLSVQRISRGRDEHSYSRDWVPRSRRGRLSWWRVRLFGDASSVFDLKSPSRARASGLGRSPLVQLVRLICRHIAPGRPAGGLHWFRVCESVLSEIPTRIIYTCVGRMESVV